MNLTTTITTSFLSFACLFCAGSTAIHDTGIDNMAQRLMTAGNYHETTPSVMIRRPHTHSERGSLYQAIRDAKTSVTDASNDPW